MMSKTNACGRPVTVFRYRKGHWETVSDTVSLEMSVVVSWHDASGGAGGRACLYAWPHDLACLALGHVLLERIPPEQCLHRQASVTQEAERAFSVRIGKELPVRFPVSPVACDARELLSAMRSFMSGQGQWDDTGCFHRAGVFDPAQGRLLFRSEDIGRHNCLDRLAGWSALSGACISDKVLLVSARMTASLCAKALRAGFRLLVSRSAVTSSAIEMAEKAGAALVGFARTEEERFTVFADPLRRISATPGKGNPYG